MLGVVLLTCGFGLQFLSSRPSTPVPFRPKRSNTLDLEAGSPLSGLRNEVEGASKSGEDTVAKLEAHVEKGERAEQVNGTGEEKGEQVNGTEKENGKVS